MPLAYIALGANLPSSAGLPEVTLAAAAQGLAAMGRIIARSSLYSTAPVGREDQPRFLNAVVALETQRSPRELLDSLLAIEQAFGRDRAASVPNGPRTLDLDILLYGDLAARRLRPRNPSPPACRAGLRSGAAPRNRARSPRSTLWKNRGATARVPSRSLCPGRRCEDRRRALGYTNRPSKINQ